MNKKLFLVSALIFAFTFVSCISSNTKNEKKEEVILQSKSNSKAAGTLTVSELSDGGIRIVGKIVGLAPNSVHGFHVHEKGNCSDAEAMNAGGHFNPDKEHVHGASIANEAYIRQHAGDLGNMKANASGVANIDLTLKFPKFTLESGDKYSIIGKAFVIHANPDDEKSSPAGNSGKRILCGVIQ